MIDITQADLIICKQSRARARHLRFMEYCWNEPSIDFVIGTHTREICARLDKAMDDYRNGKSSYICCLVAARHGKTEMTSRHFVPHFLGEFPDAEVLTTSYNDDRSGAFSRDAKAIISTAKYKELYPNVKLSHTRNAVGEWCLEGHRGKAQYISLQSGTAGVGANLCIIDDYFGKPEQARSQVIRDQIWNNFMAGIFQRLMHPCICLVIVTPWHVDDLVGRIRKGMETDPEFPPFEFLVYPAFSDSYPTGTLFPEKYPMTWYTSRKAVILSTQGNSFYSAVMQCNPKIDGGNYLKTSMINFYKNISDVV